jgi:signal transduction histidine kinase
MTRTIDALVAAARQESGLSRSTSDARDAVTRAADAATPLAAANGIEISVTLPDAPLRIAVEAELVERMLHPLLDNACQYGRASVEIALARVETKAVITVTDDGPGVTDEEQETIFEPGVRGQTGRQSSNGSGLGLALALRVARSAGATITTTPNTGGGCFTLALPLAQRVDPSS